MKLGACLLTEGYEDRVKQVADQVFDHYHNTPVTRDQLRASIEARMHGIPLGSLKPAEFVKDVLANLAKRMNLKKGTSDVSAQLDALAQRMSHMLADTLIPNYMPDVPLHDLPDIIYAKFKRPLDAIFWDLPIARTQSMGEWFDRSVWPRVLRAFRKHQGANIQEHVAQIYDQMMNDLAHDAAVQGKQVEPYLRQMGFSLDNPYR